MAAVTPPPAELVLEPIDLGFFLGLLVGEGSFGGDGRQPQITLRMHVRHADLFARLTELVPGSRLYGPYHHGGRHYHQWMVRGPALRDRLVPLVARHRHLLDGYTRSRFDTMCATYGLDAGAGEPQDGRRPRLAAAPTPVPDGR
jgi:hypothetical protein